MSFRTVSFIFVWIYFANSAHGLQKLPLFMKFREKFYCASSALEISNYQLRKAIGKGKCGIRPSQIVSAVILDVFHFLKWFSETSHSPSFLSSPSASWVLRPRWPWSWCIREQHLCQPASLSDPREPNTPSPPLHPPARSHIRLPVSRK